MALLNEAEESRTFNPHFYLADMLAKLGTDEGTFNIAVHSLGARYCYFVDVHDGRPRYAINLAECLSLKDQLDGDAVQEARHRELIRLGVSSLSLGRYLVGRLPSGSVTRSVRRAGA
ncbi:MAG: hypothetical protein ACYC7F_12070 [Gemmatimonadaceae bacterium]